MMFDLYTTDKDGYVHNGADTFRCAALDVIHRNHVVLTWTDQLGTILNILLSYAPTRVGPGGGVVDNGPAKLWVGIAGKGCFAFGMERSFLHESYISEKLGVTGATAYALAVLITSIRNEIRETSVGGNA